MAEPHDSPKPIGRPRDPDKGIPIKLRIPPDILAAYRAEGAGYQTRMIEALRRGVE